MADTNIEVEGTTVATVDSANNVTYLALSLLKTTKMTVNGAGSPSGVATYYPYGAENASITAEYKFTNQIRDPNGIDHFWMRSYSATLGRWLTPDPAGLAAVDPSNPQSWNRYAYVLNNPMTYIDPLGLYTTSCSGTTSLILCNLVVPPGYAAVENYRMMHATLGYFGGTINYDLVPSYMAPGFDGQTYMHSQWVPMDFQPNIPSHPTGGGGGVPGGGPRLAPHNGTGQYPTRMFGTHWCGPGGAGPTVNQLDTACKAHDQCYDAHGFTPGSNWDPFQSPSQIQALQQCNQNLCNAASQTNDPGSTRVVFFFTQVIPVGACRP